MKEDFIPLSVPVLRGNESKYLNECITSGWVSSAGPWVNRFEREFASFVGARGAVSVVNGTAAIHLALMISGVNGGDEVIAPTLTFIAPINAIRYLNAFPVFMDCDQHLNIDVDKLEIFLKTECHFDGKSVFNKKSGRQIKAILPVHVFGHPVEMKKLLELSAYYRLPVVEDATEGLGSRTGGANGEKKSVGTQGLMGCFSFNGNKIITTGGGGMIVSDDQKILDRARYLATQAKNDDVFYVHDEIGYNYRLTSLQAAVGVAQLEQLPDFVEAKRTIFKNYQKLFSNFSFGELIVEPEGTISNYWLTSLRLKDEAGIDMRKFVDFANSKGIQVRPVWKLNHQQKPYVDAQAFEVSRAESTYPCLVNLPSSVNLTEADASKVFNVVREACEKLAIRR